MRDFLVGAGFHEAVTFSLISSQGYSDEDMSKMVRLRNPLQAGLEWMRPSLLPSLLPAISRNLRYGNQNIALFELAHVYSLHSAKDVRENNSIGFTLCGQMQSHSWLDAARDASYF